MRDREQAGNLLGMAEGDYRALRTYRRSSAGAFWVLPCHFAICFLIFDLWRRLVIRVPLKSSITNHQ